MTNDKSIEMLNSEHAATAEPKATTVADERVTINVGGRRFETYDSVLRRLPKTLLGDEQRRAVFWDAARREFFFDRSSSSFEGILLSHQTGGDAWRPPGVPLHIFVEDLKFFGFTEQAARVADSSGYRSSSARRESESEAEGRCERLTGQPLIVLVSQLATLIAVVAYIVATLPTVQPSYLYPGEDYRNPPYVEHGDGPYLKALLVVEFLCMIVVFLELIKNFRSAGWHCQFFLDPLNVLDLVMTLPFFVCFVIVLFTGVAHLSYENKALYWIINLIRVLRLFRIFRVLRETNIGQLLKRVVVASSPALGLIVVLWMAAVTFFASLMYWAEDSEGQDLVSIFLTIYWAVITMTTVGYGDIYPKSNAGRFFSALCGYAGYIMLVLPVAILVTKLAQCSREDEQNERKHKSNDRLL